MASLPSTESYFFILFHFSYLFFFTFLHFLLSLFSLLSSLALCNVCTMRVDFIHKLSALSVSILFGSRNISFKNSEWRKVVQWKKKLAF